MKMHQGIIEVYLPHRQYGFVREDSGRKLFFHKDCCKPGFQPQLGARVEFEIAPSYTLGKPDQAIKLREIVAAVQS
jgi:cold shock CspA family protein